MNDILICTMGYSPGVVTGITHHLQQKGLTLSEVWVVVTTDSKIQLIFDDIVFREFDNGCDLRRKTSQTRIVGRRHEDHGTTIRT